MQNENAGKTVEQMAAEKYPFRDFLTAKSDSEQKEIDRHNRAATLQRLGFIDGYTHAQQSQPMWREIEDGEDYEQCLVKSDEKRIRFIDWCDGGNYLLYIGYTHYLSSDDLLKLPTEKK